MFRPTDRAAVVPGRLDPGAFAVVMATGIVAVDLRDHRPGVIWAVLFVAAAATYAVLVALTVWRVVAFAPAVRTDLADPARGFGFFTFVAATDVLGTLFASVQWRAVAVALLVVGTVGWLVTGYAVPLAVLRNRDGPAVAGANGTWFLWVVGVQSVAVLAASVEPTTATGRRELALLAVACWSIGIPLYAAVALAVAVALMLRPPAPADLAPSFWVAMGATAITAVAGGRILGMAAAPAVDPMRGLVAAVSLGILAFGSWLIPPLLAVGWWRHVTHRVPLRYEAAWWSVVFPLGMYAAAGHDLGSAEHLPLVVTAGDGLGWLALAAWLVTLAALFARGAVATAPRPRYRPGRPRRRADPDRPS